MPKKTKSAPRIHALFGPLAGFVISVTPDQMAEAIEGKWAVEYGSNDNPAAGMSAEEHYTMLDAAYAGAEELKGSERVPYEDTQPEEPPRRR
jgi:hypothetical protein